MRGEDSEVVFQKFPKFLLRVIGHLETLLEECSPMELFLARDDLLVHGLEKRCRIRG